MVFLEGKHLEERFRGLQARFPGVRLTPFARRCGNDDGTCWAESGGGLKVYVVHDFSEYGWHQSAELVGFWSCYQQAIDDMIEHDQPYR